MQVATRLRESTHAAAAARQRALHTFVAYVEDKPGVLTRVAALFSRRVYNIDSLAVGRTDVEGVSRMTIGSGSLR